MTLAPDPSEAQEIDRIRRQRRENLGRLLLRAFRAFDGQVIASLREAGVPDLRRSDSAVLAFLDSDGTRLTVLARRAGITKQAMGRIAADLEGRGLVTIEADPADSRAKIVRYTEAGWGAVVAAQGIIRELEARIAAAIGPENLPVFRDWLERVVAAGDPTVEVAPES